MSVSWRSAEEPVDKATYILARKRSQWFRKNLNLKFFYDQNGCGRSLFGVKYSSP
jgi:hypothetical protein